MMDAQASFQDSALQLAEQQDSPPWLGGLRQQGAAQFAQAQWPSRKTEAWKYTPLAPLQKNAFVGWAANSGAETMQADWLAVDAHRLVFVNGEFSVQASTDLPATVVRFVDADAAQQAIIEQHLGQVVDSTRHLFAALS
ncbi:MAG: hypothetical protein WED11_01450, partial [Natronospirillum sp.]